MKKFTAMLLAVLLLCCPLCACGKQSSPAAIYGEIVSAVELPAMITLSDDFVQSYYGIDLSLLEEYRFSCAADSADVEMIMICKANDKKAAEQTEAALSAVLQTRRDELEAYSEELYAVAKNGVVVRDGEWVYMVIAPDRDAIISIIEKNI